MPDAPPSRLAGLQMLDPHLAAGAGSLGRSFVGIPASAPEPLPGEPGPLEVSIAGAGRMWDLPSWNAATHGTSLVVVAGGAVVHEWYADGLGPQTLLLGASATKSALAHLVGIAVGEGLLGVDDPVVDHVPELAGGGYAGCTVRHLLTMTTGVDWVEDHRDPDGPASRLVGCFSAGGGSSRELLTGIRPADPPGSRFEYCTADSQVLDWVRERATGMTYAVALQRLWARVGATDDAVVGVDEDGVAMAGGALAATARDWARVALLQLDGTVGGAGLDRVVDPSWTDLTSLPSLPFLRPGRLPSTITTHAGFGGHWWPLDDAGRRVTADGSRGQFAYADRDLGVVVVKTSQWPYADFVVDRQCRDLSYLGLPVIAEAAAAAAAGSSHTG